MNIPTKKLKDGFEMPVYGLGTWQMGGKMSHDPDNDDATDIKAIQSAIDLGVRHIDTAEVYADGYAEILVGKAIQDYDRSNLFLVSKVYSNHMTYDALIQACKDSLIRMKTDYLDLYLLHRYPETTLKEAMRALDTLKEEGLIKNIGISNFNVERMKEAQANSKYKIVANQVHLNLKYRESEQKGVLKYCQEQDVMLIAWRPTQKGFLLEKIPPILQATCEKYGKTPAQIAINWLISQKSVVTLAKTSNVRHLKENVGAVDWIMEKEDIEMLRNEFPNQESISDSVPLD